MLIPRKKIVNSQLVIQLLIVAFYIMAQPAFSQNSFISLFGDKIKEADKAYLEGDYSRALRLYEEIEAQKKAPKNINLRLARSYFLTQHYTKSIKYYSSIINSTLKLQQQDKLNFADALIAKQQYPQALEILEEVFEENPGNSAIAEKIWRINNLNFLFEDSLKNAVHLATFNTNYSDIQAQKIGKNQAIVVSNTPKVKLIAKVNESTNQSFYSAFTISFYEDPFTIAALNYENKRSLNDNFDTDFHLLAISLYDNNRKMVYAASSNSENSKGNYPVQIYFAKKIGAKWIKTASFDHNNTAFNFTDPSIDQQGQRLYFSSDKEGGYGGKDLYVSYKENSEWTKPQNLGESINTAKDERFPFIHKNENLYFSSNGFSGLGGFDIFKAKLKGKKIAKVQNMGFPINSSMDELSFSVDSLGQEGFLSSNRRNEGLDYDIYEFALDLQTYPLQVAGNVKFIEHNWMDSSELEILPNVLLELIDVTNNTVVSSSSTNQKGEFSMLIPYYSKYKIRIKGADLDGFVSFEVPRFAKQDLSYEIVVVNDDFKNSLRDNNE